MRVTRWIRVAVAGTFTLFCASCSDTTAPPSELPVTLTTSAAPIGPPPPATVMVAGDSAVGVAVLSTSGCYDYAAAAGNADGALVLTITGTETDRFCLASLASTTFRVAAHRVPRGRYDVVLRQQTVRANGTAISPVELARQAATLP